MDVVGGVCKINSVRSGSIASYIGEAFVIGAQHARFTFQKKSIKFVVPRCMVPESDKQ